MTQYNIDNDTGEIVEAEDKNEIALKETNEIINYEQLYDFYEQKQYIEEQIKLMTAKAKPELIAYIKAHGNKPIKYHDLTISYRKGYMKTNFDSKKFKEDNEELYNKYTHLTGIDETISVKFGGKD